MGRGARVSTAITRSTRRVSASRVVSRITVNRRRTCPSASISTAPFRPTRCRRFSESSALRASYASSRCRMTGTTVRLRAEFDQSRETALPPSWPKPFRFLTPFGRAEMVATALELSLRGWTSTFVARSVGAGTRVGGLPSSNRRDRWPLRTSGRRTPRERRAPADARRHGSPRRHRVPNGLRRSGEARSRLEAPDMPRLRIFD